MPSLAALMRERSAALAEQSVHDRALSGGTDLLARAMRKPTFESARDLNPTDHASYCALSQRNPDAWGRQCTCHTEGTVY